MKQRSWLFPAIIIFVLGALALNACTYSVQVLSTPSVVAQTVTEQASTPAINTPQILETPTPILPSATPTLISIRADTLSMLENFGNFTLGDNVRGVAFTPDGAVLAAAGGNDSDYAIHFWNVASGKSIVTLSQHTGIVWGIAFSPDGQLLASVSSDKTAKIWDWRNGTLIKSIDFPGQVVSVSFSPDGQTLAVGGVNPAQNQIQSASIWTFTVGSWKPALTLPEFLNITALAYSPKSGVIIGGGTSRNVQVWRTDTGAPLFTLNHAHQVSKVAISPDGATVAAGTCAIVVNSECNEGSVWLWDLPTGKLIKKLNGIPSMVESLAFSADGSSLIVGARNGTLRIYATADYASHFEVTSPGSIDAMSISPDGGLLATGGDNGEVHLWKIVYHP